MGVVVGWGCGWWVCRFGFVDGVERSGVPLVEAPREGDVRKKRIAWRCECADWAATDAPVAPGTPHHREEVPGASVHICYYVDEPTRTITVLKIRSMDGEGAS